MFLKKSSERSLPGYFSPNAEHSAQAQQTKTYEYGILTKGISDCVDEPVTTCFSDIVQFPFARLTVPIKTCLDSLA